MRAAIARARQTQVVLMTLSAARLLGRIGHYGELAARLGFVSIHFVNVIDYDQPLVAYSSVAAAPRSANPLCIALPGGVREPPFILDFATSMVAYGKTRVAYLAGAGLTHRNKPAGPRRAATADQGHVESPPAFAADGEHKGSGLVAAYELLAGLLSGGGNLQPGNPRAGGILNNMTTILIDPARLADMDWLRQEFDAAWRAGSVRPRLPRPGQLGATGRRAGTPAAAPRAPAMETPGWPRPNGGALSARPGEQGPSLIGAPEQANRHGCRVSGRRMSGRTGPATVT